MRSRQTAYIFDGGTASTNPAAGVILRDFSLEGSRADSATCRANRISASRQMLRKLSMTPRIRWKQFKLSRYLIFAVLCLTVACSPRDFLTRRLATDLIAGSETFKTTQLFWLRTGVISNKDYTSPEYLVLRRHGWITGSTAACTPDLGVAPCWDVVITPLGVDALRDWVAATAATSQYISVPVAQRELLGLSGIRKNGNFADVDFQWRWAAVNEVGSALYAKGTEYNSTVGFAHYDDGWRVIEGGNLRSSQGLNDALKNAEPVP
jgi:hypothetical protein